MTGLFEIFAAVTGGIAALFTATGISYKFLMRDVKRDVADVKRDVADVAKNISELEHADKNQRAEIQALNSEREKAIERIVKLETSMKAIEKGQERIENTLSKMEEKAADARAEIIESIRELRSVAVKKD